MTKAQFSRAIKVMLASVTSIPDELWATGFPTISVRLGKMEAYIGLRPISGPYEEVEGESYHDED